VRERVTGDRSSERERAVRVEASERPSARIALPRPAISVESERESERYATVHARATPKRAAKMREQEDR
jgi:hypothetical protein